MEWQPKNLAAVIHGSGFRLLGSSRLVGIAQLPFTITHDQQALDA